MFEILRQFVHLVFWDVVIPFGHNSLFRIMFRCKIVRKFKQFLFRYDTRRENNESREIVRLTVREKKHIYKEKSKK